MSVVCKPLIYPFALIVGMASAGAIETKGKLYVQSPAAYSLDAGFVRNVKDECAPETKLADYVRKKVGGQFSEVIPIGNPAEAGSEKVLVLTIFEISGVGGGAWSGSKGITAEARLLENGKQFGQFKDSNSSRGGMFGGFKGTCSILDRAAESLAEDIADWLAELKPGEGVAVEPAAQKVATEQKVEPCTISGSAFSGRDYIHAVLLLSRSDAEVRTAATALYYSGVRHLEMCDMLAEVTWSACSGKRTLDPDTLAWLGKALGGTKQLKYAAVLDECIAKLGDGNIRDHMTQSRAHLDNVATPPFQGGQMDLPAAYARLKQQTAAGSGIQSSKGFEVLRAAQGIEETISALGFPDEITASSVSGSSAGNWFIRIPISSDAILVRYKDQGVIRFAFREGSNDWRLVDATSDKGMLWLPDEGRLLPVDERIANGSASQLRYIAERLMERSPLDRHVLDGAANRIHRDRDSVGDDLADSLAWLCKVLGQSKDGRYRSFLLDVSKTAQENQLRKYAGKVAAELPETSADPYTPTQN
jgi:hypothetical protein